RNGVGFLDEARGFAGELVAVEPGELKGILRVVNRYAHERFRALAHQAGVRAEDEHDRLARTREELVDLEAFQRDHDISVTTRSSPKGRHVCAGGHRASVGGAMEQNAVKLGCSGCCRDDDERQLTSRQWKKTKAADRYCPGTLS